VTPLVDAVADSTCSADDTNTHQYTNRDHEALERAQAAAAAAAARGSRGGCGRGKRLTLSDGHTEEALLHNDIISTSDKDVEELILNTSEGDLSLRGAAVIVIVVDTDLATVFVASKIDLDLSGKVSDTVAGRDSDPVIVTNDLVPVALTRKLPARSIAHVTVGCQTIVIVRKAADTNGSLALSVDHRSLLVDVKHEDATAASETGDKDPVVLTRVGSPLDLRRTATSRIIIVDLHAVLTSGSIVLRAVVVELEHGIKASVTVASGGDELGASANDSNPDTPHGLVAASATGQVRKHGVILYTPWEGATVDEPSLLARAVDVILLLVEVNVEVAARVLRILSSDKDVVSLAILSNEGSISATILWRSLDNATHLVTVLVDLDTGLELVELVASGSSDGLRITIVTITPPATTTHNPTSIARLIVGFERGSVAVKNVREAVDILCIPALVVVSLLIRHDSKIEGNTIDGRRGGGNSNVVRVGGSKEDNLGTETAVIIIAGDTLKTRTVMGARIVGLALLINVDDRIVDSGRAGASGNDELAVGTLHTEVHGVDTVEVTALREGSVHEIGSVAVVVGDGSDHDGLIAEAVSMQCARLDGQSETTTGVVEASNEDVVLAVLDGTPRDQRSTIAGIVVGANATLSTSIIFITLSEDGDDGIVVSVGVASVSNVRFAVTSDLVPETSSGQAGATVVDREASASLTLNSERKRLLLNIHSLLALIVVGRENLRGGEVVSTSGVQEASDVDVIGFALLSGESHTALPLVATIIVHSYALVDETTGSVARTEDKDDRIHRSTLIASVENDSLALTLIGVPDTLGGVLVSVTLN